MMIRDFSRISESVLGNIDDRLNTMDSEVEEAKIGLLYSLFPPIDGSSAANSMDHGIAIRHMGTYYGGLVLKKFINNCCSIDKNIITVDLSKYDKCSELTVDINPKPLEEYNIMVKVIDNPNRKNITDLNEISQTTIYPSIAIANTNKFAQHVINLKNIIHPDTKVASVQFGNLEWAKYSNTILADTTFPGKIDTVAYYNCEIKKITKLPKTIQLSRPLIVSALADKFKFKYKNIVFGNVRTCVTMTQ